MAILNKFEQRVERVCLVDKPVDYPFLPDSLFSYMAKSMPKLQVNLDFGGERPLGGGYGGFEANL